MNILFASEPATTVVGVIQLPSIAFTVFGTPTPQGSMRAFYKAGMKRPILTSDNSKLKPWRQQISATAQALNVPPFAREAAIAMSLNFFFTKPPSVSKRRNHPTVKPDIDKLVRAILDGLTGILFADDAQVVRFDAIEKHYGGPDRVEIQVRVL